MLRVWKMTAISLEVFKWAEWDIVFPLARR